MSTFEDWKSNVDGVVFAAINIHCNELPDKDYWMYWNNEVSYFDMAKSITKEYLKFIENIKKK